MRATILPYATIMTNAHRDRSQYMMVKGVLRNEYCILFSPANFIPVYANIMQ